MSTTRLIKLCNTYQGRVYTSDDYRVLIFLYCFINFQFSKKTKSFSDLVLKSQSHKIISIFQHLFNDLKKIRGRI